VLSKKKKKKKKKKKNKKKKKKKKNKKKKEQQSPIQNNSRNYGLLDLHTYVVLQVERQQILNRRLKGIHRI